MGSVIKRSQYMGVCGVVSTARSGGGLVILMQIVGACGGVSYTL